MKSFSGLATISLLMSSTMVLAQPFDCMELAPHYQAVLSQEDLQQIPAQTPSEMADFMKGYMERVKKTSLHFKDIISQPNYSDKEYSFKSLMMGNEYPPILEEVSCDKAGTINIVDQQGKQSCYNGYTLSADKALQGESLNWWHYFNRSYDRSSMLKAYEQFKKNNTSAQAGFCSGVNYANQEIEQISKQMWRDYKGMLAYKKLLAVDTGR